MKRNFTNFNKQNKDHIGTQEIITHLKLTTFLISLEEIK